MQQYPKKNSLKNYDFMKEFLKLFLKVSGDLQNQNSKFSGRTSNRIRGETLEEFTKESPDIFIFNVHGRFFREILRKISEGITSENSKGNSGEIIES